MADDKVIELKSDFRANSRLSYPDYEDLKEHNSGEQLTIADQAITIKELFDRYRSGVLQMEDIYIQGSYDFEGDAEDEFSESYDPTEQYVQDITDVEEALEAHSSAQRSSFGSESGIDEASEAQQGNVAEGSFAAKRASNEQSEAEATSEGKEKFTSGSS